MAAFSFSSDAQWMGGLCPVARTKAAYCSLVTSFTIRKNGSTLTEWRGVSESSALPRCWACGVWRMRFSISFRSVPIFVRPPSMCTMPGGGSAFLPRCGVMGLGEACAGAKHAEAVKAVRSRVRSSTEDLDRWGGAALAGEEEGSGPRPAPLRGGRRRGPGPSESSGWKLGCYQTPRRPLLTTL